MASQLIIEAIKQGAKAKLAEIVQNKAEEVVGQGVEVLHRNLVNPNAKSKSEHEKPIQVNEISSSGGKKRKLQEDPETQIEVPKTMQRMEQDGVQPEIKMGGAANGVGIRGPLSGNTQLNEKYSAYYEELQELHSRKVKNLDIWYGMAANQNGGNPTDSGLSGIGANWAPANNNTANNGVYLFPLDAGTPQAGSVGGGILTEYPLTATAGQPPDNLMQRPNSLSDAVVAAPINFCVDDLLDNKLLANDGQTGLMTQYSKFRLIDFSIELTLKSYNASSAMLARSKTVANVAGYQAVGESGQLAVPFNSSETLDRNNCEYPIDLDYWIYRDFYNDFASAGDPTIPVNWFINSAGQAPRTIDRRVRGLRNLDIYLTLLQNEERFKITRKINERASYYFTLEQLQALRARPLQYLVNLMEGIVPSTTDLTALQEGFNLLIAPTQCPLNYSATKWGRVGATNPPNWYLVTPGITTKVYVKIHATWKAFDFSYAASNPSRGLSDPEYTEACRHYNEWIEHIQKHRRSRCTDYNIYYNIKKVKRLDK